MLERATGYFETAGRRFLRDSTAGIQTRQSISRHFWKHNTGGDATHWFLAFTHPPDQPTNLISNISPRSRSPADSNLPFLDFLYPPTPQQSNKFRLCRLPKRVGLRRRKRTISSLRRTYVSEASSLTKPVELDYQPQGTHLEQDNHTYASPKPIKATEDLWKHLRARRRKPKHFDNAWVLFIAAGRPREALSELCACLSKSSKPTDLDRAWEAFSELQNPSDEDFLNITHSQLQSQEPKKLVEICSYALKMRRGRPIFALSFTHFLRAHEWALAEKIWILRSQFNDEQDAQIVLPNNEIRIAPEEIEGLMTYLMEKKSASDFDPQNLRDVTEFLLGRMSTSLNMLKDTPMDVLNTIMQKSRRLGLSSLQHYVNIIETLQSSTARLDFARSLIFYHQMRVFFYKQLRTHDVHYHARKELLSRQLKVLIHFEMAENVLYFLNELTHFYGKPNIQQYKDVMNMFARSGDVSQVTLVFNKLVADYGKPKSRKLLIPLLHVHAVLGNVPETFNQFQRIQAEFHLEPNTVCWNVVLTAYAAKEDLAGAFSHFSKMVQAGVQLNSHTFGIMMSLCANRGDIAAVRQLLQQAEEKKVPVTMTMLGTVAQAYISSGRVDLAEQLAMTCLDSKVEGSPMQLLNTLLMQYAYRIDHQSFKRVMEHMDRAGFTPDATTHAADLLRMSLIGSADKARRTLRRMHKSGVIHATEVHYAIVLLGFIKVRNLQMAQALLREIYSRFPDSGIASSIRNFEAAIHVNSKSTQHEKRLKTAEEVLLKSISERGLTSLVSMLPSAAGRKETIAKSFDTWNHEYLIKRYGSKGAMDLAREMFERYMPTSAEDGGENMPTPIRLISAMMITHSRADQHQEVDECWKLAMSSAIKLASRINVEPLLRSLASDGKPVSEEDLFSDSSLFLPMADKNRAPVDNVAEGHKSEIIPARRFTLSKPLNIYMRSLAYRDKLPKIAQVVAEVQAAGFELSTFNWTTYVQMLADSDKFANVSEAFRLNEEIFMPNWPGWKRLKRGQTYKPPGTPRGVYLLENPSEPEHSKHFLGRKATKYWSGVAPEFMQPTYKMVVYLAAALEQIRETTITKGGHQLDDLFAIAPMTVEAISKMPYLRDWFQGILIRKRERQSEKERKPFPRGRGIAEGGILGSPSRLRRRKTVDTLKGHESDKLLNQKAAKLGTKAKTQPNLLSRTPGAKKWENLLKREDMLDFQTQLGYQKTHSRRLSSLKVPRPTPRKPNFRKVSFRRRILRQTPSQKSNPET
ncbi:hypothetical protein N7478_004276 [Penicillium angulare]|uniref:uncharacterized protein n=1 Tax=Penicillium angulare TaxID=116970 RepID=UPI002540AA8A|nr:uncharacterized protein N7478_004276 [Penicillium angulare]KAJ5278904.1 hypothetical protein N7478_004276 [Penicillium angulare]